MRALYALIDEHRRRAEHATADHERALRELETFASIYDRITARKQAAVDRVMTEDRP